jgi:hypothetical protein
MKPQVKHQKGQKVEEGAELYSVKWNNYPETILEIIRKYLVKDVLTDVTLSCDGGQSIPCHRLLLSACSTYFEEVLASKKHPAQTNNVFFFRNMEFWELEALVNFMYYGEVRVAREKLTRLVKAAAALKIKGLAPEVETGMDDEDEESEEEESLDSAEFPFKNTQFNKPISGSLKSKSGSGTPQTLSLLKRKVLVPIPGAHGRKVQKKTTNGVTTPKSHPPSSSPDSNSPGEGLTEEDRKVIADYERRAVQEWTKDERIAAGVESIMEGDSEGEQEQGGEEDDGDGLEDYVSWLTYFY